MMGNDKGKDKFFRKSKKTDTDVIRFESLSSDIPFYGKKGTICRIEVSKDLEGNELCYHTVLYNHDGTINSRKINTPRNKGRNLSLLLDSYYEELKRYLEFYSNEYLDNKNNSIKNKMDKRKNEMMIVIFLILAFIASGVFFKTTGIISLISAVMAGTIGTIAFVQIKNYSEFIKSKKNKINLHDYEKLQSKLVEYLKEKDKLKAKENKKKTTFTPIANVNRESLENDRYKVRLLVKEESKEAA